MKRVRILQCLGLVLGLLGFLNYAEYSEVNKRLDSIEYKIEHIYATEQYCSNEDIVTKKIHTLIGVEDTEEQIQEEIRLGEMEMLAQLIEAEAGTEDYIGKCLVADVVLNRRDSDDYPDTIEEVIQDRFPCVQFTSVSIYDGGFERAGWHISEDSFRASKQEYEATHRLDENILFYTEGYYNPYCIPGYIHGRHYFGY